MPARALTALAALALVLLVGCSVPDATPTTPPAPPTVTVVSPQPAAVPGLEIPVRVRIPAIGVDSDLLPTGMLPSGELEVPPLGQPEQASAVDWSPAMAAQMPTVLLGHVDGAGRDGVFHDLDQLDRGDEVLVDRGGQTTQWRVTEVERLDKDEFPADRVYGGGPAGLRLISCTGQIEQRDGERHYDSNLVVWAVPADVG